MLFREIFNNKRLLVTGHTGSVLPNDVFRTGATPVFTDVDPDTFGSSPKEIRKKLVILRKNIFLIIILHPDIVTFISHTITKV